MKKFILNMQGGKQKPSGQLDQPLQSPSSSYLNIKGQNGKKVINKKLALRVSGCKG